MKKTESYCYQKYKSPSNNSCVIKEKNIVGKNLLEGTYFDGNGIPKTIGITKDEYFEYKKLQQKNQKLQERIEYLERSNNRREDTILEQRQEISDLEDNWNKLKEFVLKKQAVLFNTEYTCYSNILDKMQELEQGSDSNE